MQHLPKGENDFLNKLREAIEANMADEQFGVSELADQVGMSRSNLLRKVKKLTELSVSQFIRVVRLEKAMEILKDSSLNVSEVSFQVGFNSTSYFVKCFREHYGYPPGEVGKQSQKPENVEVLKVSDKKNTYVSIASFTLLAIIAVVTVWLMNRRPVAKDSLEKSIAVLPFKNDSNDSTNLYLINGLMESTLNNLQKIGDLRVISRTSVEQYRNSPKSIPEIAKELGVSYFVEGSGQKIGNKILLNIQLIDGNTDGHLWAEQYERETDDIFSLQQEIASSIASKIKVLITPVAKAQITKIPTDNLIAYDNFLKAQNLVDFGDMSKLSQAIPYFKKAIELDEGFALSYAGLTVCYFYLDVFLAEKKYTEEIKEAAEKAMQYDPKLPESLIAKALSYRQIGKYEAMIPVLEEALEYNPNSVSVINMLSDLYATFLPNTEKYLEYALKAIQLDVASSDSLTTSFVYLHLSNALIQSGFVEESIFYVDRSLDYSQNNGFSHYVKAFMLYAQDRDMEKLRSRLITEWKKDESRLDILQEIGKISFFMRDYETAYQYYSILLDEREALKLDIFRYENLKIGIVYEELGRKEEAEKLYKDYYDFAINDESFYKDIFMYAYHAHFGNTEKALEYLRSFSELDNYQYWFILFSDDPSDELIAENAEAKRLWKVVENKFWNNHERLRKELEVKGLL